MTLEFTVVKAPEKYDRWSDHVKVFLGGSIEMGKAEDWQTRLTNDLSVDDDVMVLNPRRDDWDSSWEQDPTYGTKFHEQVSWEHSAQDDADILVYYFDDDTKSPITLMELGMYAHTQDKSKLIVVRCTPKFWRYGNVKMLCDRYGIPCVSTHMEMLKILKG